MRESDTMSNQALRSKLIRLAHSKPELRADLLPLLKEAGCEKLPEGGMRDNCEKKVEEGKGKPGKEASEHPSQAKFISAVNAVVSNPTKDSPKQLERALMGIAGDIGGMSLSQLDQLQQAVGEKQDALISPESRLRSMAQIRGHALRWLTDLSKTIADAQKRQKTPGYRHNAAEKKAAKAPAKLKGKKLDALISKTYSVLGNGVQIMLMDIPQIYHNALKAYEGAGTPEEATEALEKAMKTSIASVAKHKTP